MDTFMHQDSLQISFQTQFFLMKDFFFMASGNAFANIVAKYGGWRIHLIPSTLSALQSSMLWHIQPACGLLFWLSIFTLCQKRKGIRDVGLSLFLSNENITLLVDYVYPAVIFMIFEPTLTIEIIDIECVLDHE